jgi:hypothetical protein
MYNAWDGEWQYGVDGEELAKSLEVGDNFVVNVEEGNSEGQDFWLVCCTKQFHTLIHPLIYKWGTKYYERDEVVVGKYYQKWGNFDSSYVLLKFSNVVYLYSHLVKAVKFLMPPKDYHFFVDDALFELPNDATIAV